jgi:hypothetical protein
VAKKLFFAMETLPPAKGFYEEYIRGKMRGHRTKSSFISREDTERLAHKERMDLASKGEYGQILELSLLLEMEDGETFGYIPWTLTRHTELTGNNRYNTGKALKFFWAFVADLDPSTDLIVGYKIRKETLPFLCKQSAIYLEGQPPHGICFTGDRAGFVFDVLEAWNHGADEDIPLSSLVEFLSLSTPEIRESLDKRETDEAECYNRYDEITDRCRLKVDLIRSIYYRLTFQPEPPVPESKNFWGRTTDKSY